MSGRLPAKKRRVEDAVKIVDDENLFCDDEDHSSSSSSASFASPASSEDDDHLLLSDDGGNGDGKSTFQVPPMDSQDDSMLGITCSPDLMLGTQPPPKTQATPPSTSRKHTSTNTKKRKVSLSPPDSLAHGRRTSPRRASSKQPAEMIINVDDQVQPMMSMTDVLKTPIPRKNNSYQEEQQSRLEATLQLIKEKPTPISAPQPPQTKQTKQTHPNKAAASSAAPRKEERTAVHKSVLVESSKVEMVENLSMEAPTTKQSTNKPSTSNVGRDNNNNTAIREEEAAKKQSANPIPKPKPAQETKAISAKNQPSKAKAAPSKQQPKPKASKEDEVTTSNSRAKTKPKEPTTQKRAIMVNEGDAPPKKKKKSTITKTTAPAEVSHATKSQAVATTKSPKSQSTSNTIAPSKATTSKSTKKTTTSSKDTSKTKPESADTASSKPSKSTKTTASKDASSKSSKPPSSTSSTTTSEENTTNKKPKKKKSKTRTFQEELLHHLFSTCKPYTIKVLAQEMKTNEASINFCMLSLMDKNWVVKKEFTSKKGGGRSKELYWANHQEAARSKELCDALRMVPPHEMETAKQELTVLHNQQVTLTNELTLIFQEPSNEALEAQLQSHETTVQELEQKSQASMQRIRAAQQQPITTKQSRPLVIGNNSKFQKTSKPTKPLCQRRLKMRINEMRGEWKKRKDKCMDFVEQLADGLEKKVKDVVKQLELETDEGEGVKMPPKHIIDRYK